MKGREVWKATGRGRKDEENEGRESLVYPRFGKLLWSRAVRLSDFQELIGARLSLKHAKKHIFCQVGKKCQCFDF